MTLEKIRVAIKKWSEVRNSPEVAYKLLNQGTCFKIEKEQYEIWKKRAPKSIYAYASIFDSELKFVLIDSESVKDPEKNLDAIFIQDYLPGLNILEADMISKASDGNITVIEALTRNMNWVLLMQSWLENMSKTTDGVFRAFIIPFSSLEPQLEGSKNAESVLMIGLGEKKLADLILWKHSNVSGSESGEKSLVDDPYGVDNFVLPCPPFNDPDL
jgi:hypothetical protein